MDIQAEKLELVRLILETDNPGILTSIKRIFSDSTKADFFDSLPKYQQDEIIAGVAELEKGETIPFENLIKRHR